MQFRAQIQMMIGDGICMIRLKALTILAIRMLLSTCAQRDLKLFTNWSTWACHFLVLKMEEFIKDHLADSLKILEKADRQLELVQLQTEQVMHFFILFTKIMLKRERTFLMNGLLLTL